MNESILAIVLVFGAVAAVAYVVSRLLVGDNGASKLRDRLNARTGGEDAAALAAAPQESRGVAPILQRVGQAAAAPFMPNTREKQSSLRKQLGYAGITRPTPSRS